jgi:PhoPQ-activated pathogenicity-related protein
MSLKKILLVLILVIVYFGLNYAFLSTKSYSSMEDYISSTKNEFSYEIEDIIYEEEWTGFHIKMISGEWLDSKKVENTDWWHYLDIVIPKEIKTDTGIMFIDSGAEDETYFRLDSTSIGYALKAKSIIVNIHNIPFQPINFLDSEQESFYEDDLIAFAWNQFLEKGAKQKDIEWLPRLPMTRAVVRAMDLAQEIAFQNSVSLNDFVVSGASKRGWAAWTTAAVDSRVIGVVPMVIDMLNLVPSFENHFRSYGEFSPAVQSYINYDIQDWMDTEEFKTLLSYVEPFSFKENFTMPKYIINAGSDEFFSTDSWRFYYDKLPGDKLLRYVPNTNHSLNGRYLNDDLLSYFYRIINDIDMPTLKWDLSDNNLNVAIDYEGNYNVSIWSAKNQNGRDFRLWQEGELWQKINIQKSSDNNYQVEINNKSTGYEAIMMEFEIDPESDYPFIISTGPFVIPESYPFNKYEPLK